MTNAMKRTTATLITVLTAFGIACSPEGEPRSINPGLTPEPKTTPPAAATARATETLVLPPATPQKIPERMTVIPPATQDKALIINGAKDTKTINDLRMAVPIDAKIQVVADSQSLKVAIVVPTIKIYGESYLMVAGQDGKWFRPDAIENMADSGGKFTVTKTTFGEGTKGGGQIYGVSLEIPFATQKKAEFAQCVEDGRTSGYKNGCTDGILTLPDGRRFVAYSMGERVIALQDLVYRGKLYLSNDKDFPLTADNGNAPKIVQVAYAGEMANLGVLELNQRFVIAKDGEISLSKDGPVSPPEPLKPIFPELAILPDGRRVDMNNLLERMKNVPIEKFKDGSTVEFTDKNNLGGKASIVDILPEIGKNEIRIETIGGETAAWVFTKDRSGNLARKIALNIPQTIYVMTKIREFAFRANPTQIVLTSEIVKRLADGTTGIVVVGGTSGIGSYTNDKGEPLGWLGIGAQPNTTGIGLLDLTSTP